MIGRIYKYREFLKTNVKKDIRGKYKGSFLGVLWSFVNPLLMSLIYAIVFPFILVSAKLLIIAIIPIKIIINITIYFFICPSLIFSLFYYLLSLIKNQY